MLTQEEFDYLCSRWFEDCPLYEGGFCREKKCDCIGNRCPVWEESEESNGN